MAFELFKAKCEARKARKEAIIAIDRYVNALAIKLPTIEDKELKKEAVETMANLIALKDAYRKNVELPKWASEAISTALKILTLVGGVVACEITTNRGTGDKFVNNFFHDVTKI